MPRKIKNILASLSQWAGLIQAFGAIIILIVGVVMYMIHSETSDVRKDVQFLQTQVQEIKSDVKDMKSAFGVPSRHASNNTTGEPVAANP